MSLFTVLVGKTHETKKGILSQESQRRLLKAGMERRDVECVAAAIRTAHEAGYESGFMSAKEELLRLLRNQKSKG